MSGYPYTDEQAEMFWHAMTRGMEPGDAPEGHVWLRRLHEAGITVTFPRPRYQVYSYPEGAGPWEVQDTRQDNLAVARFWGYHGLRYAREHCNRLNEEEMRHD